MPVLGIEPTGQYSKSCRRKGIESVVDFFWCQLATEPAAAGRKADLLLGNNVLAHVPDIVGFCRGMKIMLKEDGVITMEFPHHAIGRQQPVDTIYHEHFSHLSFHTVKAIFASQGLEMFDVEEIPTHGGSLRIYARHLADHSKPVGPRVSALLEKKRPGLTSMTYYSHFQEKSFYRLNLTCLIF